MPVINNIKKIRKERGIKQLKLAEDLVSGCFFLFFISGILALIISKI